MRKVTKDVSQVKNAGGKLKEDEESVRVPRGGSQGQLSQLHTCSHNMTEYKKA